MNPVVHNFSDEDWANKVQEMADLGMKYIIVMGVAYCDVDTPVETFYESKDELFIYNDIGEETVTVINTKDIADKTVSKSDINALKKFNEDCKAPEKLELKEGCRVMLLKNIDVKNNEENPDDDIEKIIEENIKQHIEAKNEEKPDEDVEKIIEENIKINNELKSEENEKNNETNNNEEKPEENE